MDNFAGLCFLGQFDDIVPFDVVARLGEVVVDVEDVGVALFGADVDPAALEGKMQG